VPVSRQGQGPFSVVGHRLPKVDAWGKVTGETRFADDLVLPRMAYD
jgi:CO/xanthine dehydrogenase Mo-binding subunit